MFMKFEKDETEDEILDRLRVQSENRYFRFDEDSPWAQIACALLRSRKSKKLERLRKKIYNYRKTESSRISLLGAKNRLTSMGFMVHEKGQKKKH